MNPVGPATIATYWNRHASGQRPVAAAGARRPTTWADLGPGAGFPGVVLAILLKDTPGGPRSTWSRAWPSAASSSRVGGRRAGPARRDPQRPREELDLEGRCRHRAGLRADGQTARGTPSPTWSAGATGLVPEGTRCCVRELRGGRHIWKFESTLRSSTSDPRGRIVREGAQECP